MPAEMYQDATAFLRSSLLTAGEVDDPLPWWQALCEPNLLLVTSPRFVRAERKLRYQECRCTGCRRISPLKRRDLTGKRAPPGTRHQCRKSGTTPASHRSIESRKSSGLHCQVDGSTAARMAAMLETDARTRVLNKAPCPQPQRITTHRPPVLTPLVCTTLPHRAT